MENSHDQLEFSPIGIVPEDSDYQGGLVAHRIAPGNHPGTVGVGALTFTPLPLAIKVHDTLTSLTAGS